MQALTLRVGTLRNVLEMNTCAQACVQLVLGAMHTLMHALYAACAPLVYSKYIVLVHHLYTGDNSLAYRLFIIDF